MSRTRAFFCGFCLTAAVLVPLIGCILLLRETTVPSASQAGAEASGVPLALPGPQDALTCLVISSGEEDTGFLLVRLDAAVLHSYPHELSGGMRQRLSIALAVMYHPRLLILDEATTGLDLLVEADILGTIRKLREREGTSILMITHDRRLADAFCSRRVEIGGGHG
mgnify:CR=1 FL=1